jgi:apolipoprotein N-acyltransferase
VLFGAATRRHEGLFNSALLWHAGGLRIVRDKVRLVPITEDALTRGTPSGPVARRGRRVAALICWEVVFPGEARRAARAGADLLAVLANDAYAGDGPVPRLHLRMARLRAAEVGLPLAFAQATGPSAAIGPDGRVLARIAAGRAGSLDADLPRAAGATLYRRTGDLVGPGATLASLIVAVRRARRPGGPHSRGGGA